MDELDILKKDWQKGTVEYPKLSAKDIYPMLLKKSSSIVKLIFYISIAELVFWILLNSLPFVSDSYRASFDEIQMSDTLFYGINIVSYGVICIFIYFLYKAYQSISVVDNARELMEKILLTRKIVKYYVLYNLLFIAITSIIIFYYTLNNSPEFSQQLAAVDPADTNSFWVATIGILALGVIVFGALIWLFYRLIYGILLRRLKLNYNELKKLEI